MIRALLAQLASRAVDTADELVDVAADTTRRALDDYAAWWLLGRQDLDRGLAAQLLERMGAQLRAKIEYDAPP